MASDRYTKTAIALHWVIALLIVIQLASGIVFGYRLAERDVLFPLIQLHKSLGLTILILSVFRLAWRLTHRPPALPNHMPAWEKLAARASHIAFYAFLIGVPLSGWLLVSSSPMNFPTIWFGLFEWPHLPGVAALDEDSKNSVNTWSETAHVWMAYSMLALLVVHIAAALKHHFIDRDAVLHHMVPVIKPKSKLGLVLLPFLLIPHTAQAAAWTIQPAVSHIAFSGENSGSPFKGQFEKWQGEIDLDTSKLETAKIRIVIDTRSARTGDATYDATLPTREWFGVNDFPEAVFVSKQVRSLGGTRYETLGSLTIKSVTRDIVLPFTLTIADGKASVKGQAVIDRLAFDIGRKSDAKAEWVSRDIKIDFDLAADQK